MHAHTHTHARTHTHTHIDTHTMKAIIKVDSFPESTSMRMESLTLSYHGYLLESRIK